MGNVRGRDHLDEQNAVGMIILKWIFKRWGRGHGLDSCESD